MSQPPGWPAGPRPGQPPYPYQPQPPGQYQPQPPGPYQPYPPGPYGTQYPPGPVQPVGWPVPPAPPVRKRHTGLKITLSILGVLLVLCALGGFFIGRPVLEQYPATLSAPTTLAGMEKLTDPSLDQVSNEMVAQFQSQLHPTSAVGAFYAPPNDRTHAVMLAGVTSFFLFPGDQLDTAFKAAGQGDLTITSLSDVDPGSMGGAAKCATAKTADIAMSMCAWADCGSLGMVVAYNRGIHETADLLRTIRPEVLRRG